jgi:hypothetical protein
MPWVAWPSSKRVGELVGLLFVRDALADECRREQHLDRRHHALPVGPLHETLADDALDDRRENEADLVALVLGKGRDGARHGLARVERVQRAHDQVARLGGEDRGLDGLEIAHFTDQDHVGVLPKRPAQRLGERLGVVADLALVDDAELVLVRVLDRVFDRDDVAIAGDVDVMDHRGKRGALATPRGAGDEDQAAMLERHLLDHRRQLEVANGPHCGNHAQRDADVAPLWKMLTESGRSRAAYARSACSDRGAARW